MTVKEIYESAYIILLCLVHNESIRTKVDVYVNKGPLVDMVGKITKCLG